MLRSASPRYDESMGQLAIDIPRAPLRALCRKYRVKELAVFGSALGSDFRPDSDIDLFVEFEENAHIGFIKFAALQQELSEIFGRKVDLVPKRGIKNVIRDDIIAAAQIIHAA